MVRLAHISDVHVYCPDAHWRPRDWFSKRLTGWINLRFLGRGGGFRDSVDVLGRLMEDVYNRRPDLILFSGDATSLAVEEEFATTARLLGVGRPGGIPGLAVPGNHDYYTHDAAARGLFEKHFAPWLEGERIDGEAYPFARRVGPLWLIAVNSAVPHRLPWNSTGRVGRPQLDRLRRLLALPHIAAAPRILVIHYPIARADGRPEQWLRRLRDLGETLAVAVEGGVSLWLHGHRHHPYHLPASVASPIPSVCAGSGTLRGVWTYAEYQIDESCVVAERRSFDPANGAFHVTDRFELPLPVKTVT